MYRYMCYIIYYLLYMICYIVYIYIYISYSIYYIVYIILYINSDVENLQNRGSEAPKSRSTGSKIEVWRLQNRDLGASWGLLRALGASRGLQRGSRRPPGGVLGRSWGRLGAVLRARRPSLGRLGVILEKFEAILGRLGASNGCNM